MVFKLSDVNGWNKDARCLVVMLCAISGKTPQEIATVLQQAAAEYGDIIPEELRRDYNIKHWPRAFKTLGGDYTVSRDLVAVPYEPATNHRFLSRKRCDRAARNHFIAMIQPVRIRMYSRLKLAKY